MHGQDDSPTPPNAPLIRAHDLRKTFRRPRRFAGPLGAVRTLVTRQYVETVAVDRVSFTIDEGELVGYLGPNGAGKSTTIKMLTGVLVPTNGEIEVGGRVPWRDREANARTIGVVFGQRSQLWWDLPLVESLRLVAALYDVPDARYRQRLRAMAELLGLDDFLDTPVRQLSLGQRMRGDLAAAMLYDPPVLYLDEPTVGLDVLAKDAVREFIAATNRSGRTTVVLTTHDLADVAALCRRIILIDHGKVLYDDSIERLVEAYAPPRQLTVTLADGVAHPERLSVGPYSGERHDDGRYHFTVAAEDSVPALVAKLTGEYPIRDLAVAEPDLETVIKQIYADRAMPEPVR